ncbi:hypothetical protein CcrColossus_gp063 [Caulobacter phage CcrColossus]|uniref:Uncharacterized protein n=1 Tax=Caulobacter phage CcrColossus TaxID=1211640 RepID=K4JVQ7_9CAUD|nr:hypothetical protein CcrColossus_gp063 [Caulobacter phage CcrColossus]AFU87933.1 hypothetical protein CcrColossus_gp063 [Caulobacter phage CcrColossus]
MLSAKEALTLMPSSDPNPYLDAIEQRIREAAAAGHGKVMIHNVLPVALAGAWCCGRPGPLAKKIEDALKKVGYQLAYDSGGHHGPGFVGIMWAAEEEK